MLARPFHSEKVVEERISEATLKAYHIGFDQNQFRLEPLVNILCDVIPEFSLGYSESLNIAPTQMVSRLAEAANRVYLTDKYKSRGEFGELILHFLLRDFHNTIPLISKIYFKDAHNSNVHGFDGIHITTGDEKKLWLGESKLFSSGEKGIDDLIDDLENHFTSDYLRNEFELIRTKLPDNDPTIEFWRDLLDKYTTLDRIFSTIVIPMVCTYSCNIFKNHSENSNEYFTAFEKEVHKLHDRFNSKKTKIITTNLEIILLLLPIPDKNELNKRLDKRLKGLQGKC